MKIDFGRLATILARVVVAAPVVIAAVRPVLHSVKEPRG